MRKPTLIRRVTPAALLAVSALVLTACGGSGTDDAASTIVRSTTNIAGAGVVGNDREPAAACGPTAPVDPAGVTGAVRRVAHAAGETDVPADPQRIVVLDTDKLDTVCALGLQDRVVGAAVIAEIGTQPEYLGATIAGVEPIGTVEQPDLARIAALAPDLILGSRSRTPDAYEQLSAIAPTTFTDLVGTTWKENVVLDGTALGRGASARDALAGYETAAADTGRSLSASETQASIVRFVPGAVEIHGPDSFAGQVLADAGVHRPPFQRLQDRTVAEITEDELTKAEGDLVYVTFSGDEAQEQGIAIMKSDRWENLGAVQDGRVFTVDDEIWMTGNGIVAARGVLDDMEASLNGYVN